MKYGKCLGLASAVIAVALGIYFSAVPILEGLKGGEVTGREAGQYFSVIGIIVGLSCAVIGLLSCRHVAALNKGVNIDLRSGA